MSEKIYREVLMDHFRSPRNKTPINDPDFSSGQLNPSCGDKVYIEGCISNKKITKLYFDGIGCVVSLATASMLTEFCINKTLEQILSLSKEDIKKLVGIQLGPVRLKCALLPLQALQKGVLLFLEKEKNK